MALVLPKTEIEYRNALIDAGTVSAMKALQEAGLMTPYIKISQAYRLHGRYVVDRWIEEGLIKKIKDGNKSATVRIDRIQLEAVAMASNRATYLTTSERNI